MTKEKQNCYIGVDVSKHILDIYCGKTQEYKSFKNNAAGILQFCQWLSKDAIVVCEATGDYHLTLEKALHEQDIKVAVVNPRQVRDYAKAKGLLAKTDKIDAKLIADYAINMDPRLSQARSLHEEQLKKLEQRMNQLIKMIAAEKTRLDHEHSDAFKQDIMRVIEFLERQLKDYEVRVSKIIKGNNKLSNKAKKLESTPGIGKKTALNLMVHLPELGQLKGKQISKLVGVAPLNRDSGTMRGKRSIWGGRVQVRTALYLPTLTAIRCNKKIKTFYKRLRSQGKGHKQALIACMRKLLLIMNGMLKHDLAWNENYV